MFKNNNSEKKNPHKTKQTGFLSVTLKQLMQEVISLKEAGLFKRQFKMGNLNQSQAFMRSVYFLH